MKKLYDFFVKSGRTDRAQEILNIPRYAYFAEKKKVESKSKVKE